MGRCHEKMRFLDKAFQYYMNSVYTFINEKVEHSPQSILWFTRAAFNAASIKEKELNFPAAIQVYTRVIEANVPAKDEAQKRIEKIKKENWMLLQQSKEITHVGTND